MAEPDLSFYTTAVQVIPTLLVALAVELGLFKFKAWQLGEGATVPLILTGFLLAFLAASAVPAIVLARGQPTEFLEDATEIGLAFCFFVVLLALLLGWFEQARAQASEADKRRLEQAERLGAFVLAVPVLAICAVAALY